MQSSRLRPLEWVGSSRDDLKRFPDDVQDRVGYALYQAQLGLRHRDATSLSGLGPGVIEVVSDFDTNTYRTVYTVRFQEAVYVLHAFQKKSKRGITTPRIDIELVRRRLRAAEQHCESMYRKGSNR